MATITRIPAAVQRIIIGDAACSFVYFCAFGEEPSSIPISSFTATNATDPDDATHGLRLPYDVMKVARQRVLFEDAHITRITDSFASAASRPLSAEEITYLKDCLHRYIAAATTPESPAQNVKYLTWLHPTAQPAGTTATTAPPADTPFAFVLLCVRSFFPPADWYKTGTTMALLYNAHRENPNAKIVQSTLRARAADLQKAADVFEVLLVHDAADHHLIPEGSRSNYFLVSQDDRLLCSAEEDILVGITLRSARRAALRAGLAEVLHEKLTLKDLCAAKSLVMLGTSPGTLPVREVFLYTDADSKAAFEAAAQHCGIDVPRMKNLKVTSEQPPKAVLEFEVHNRVVDSLMKAFDEEAVA